MWPLLYCMNLTCDIWHTCQWKCQWINYFKKLISLGWMKLYRSYIWIHVKKLKIIGEELDKCQLNLTLFTFKLLPFIYNTESNILKGGHNSRGNNFHSLQIDACLYIKQSSTDLLQRKHPNTHTNWESETIHRTKTFCLMPTNL